MEDIEENLDDAEKVVMQAIKLLLSDAPTALAMAMPFAEAGHSCAQYHIGFIFQSSFNRIPSGLSEEELSHWYDAVPSAQWDEWWAEDLLQAFHWFVQAAERGHPEAVLQARLVAEQMHYGDLPWKDATGRRRELLDLAECHGGMMFPLIRGDNEGLNGMEYLRKYMSKPDLETEGR